MLDSVSVFWTIAPEFQFYFLFPLLWWLVHQRLRIVVPLGALAVVAVIFAFAFRYQLPGIFVASKIHIFLLGIGIAGATPFVRQWLTAFPAFATQIAAVVVFLCLIFPPTQPLFDWIYLDGVKGRLSIYYNDPVRVLILGACVASFALRDTPLSRLLFANRLSRNLGRYSFSIYLLHTPIVYAAVSLGWLRILPGPVTVIAIVLLTYGASALTFHWFEDPARVASKRALLSLFDTRYLPARLLARAPTSVDRSAGAEPHP